MLISKIWGCLEAGGTLHLETGLRDVVLKIFVIYRYEKSGDQGVKLTIFF